MSFLIVATGFRAVSEENSVSKQQPNAVADAIDNTRAVTAQTSNLITSWDPRMDVTGEPTHLVRMPPSPTRTKGAQDVGLAHSGLVRSSIVASIA
jgi:hypothetical protein